MTSSDKSVSYSVVIPVYNGRESLRRLLKNLGEQSFDRERLELLVVDDGSDDGSAEVAREFGARVIRHENNLGRVAAREAGARAAEHENLVFVDVRVVLEPEALANAEKLAYLPLMGVGRADKTLSAIDRLFYCIRKKVYHPYEPQFEYARELWLTPTSFDGRPKGLGFFMVDRKMFLDCALEEKTQDVNDDTKLLKNIVLCGAPILRHTDLVFTYEHRHEWMTLLRHTFYRGPKFLDYYLSGGGPHAHKYRQLLFVALSLVIFGVCFPQIIPVYLALFLLGYVAVCVWLAEEAKDFLVCSWSFVPIAGAFGTGIAYAQMMRWLGLRHLIRH